MKNIDALSKSNVDELKAIISSCNNPDVETMVNSVKLFANGNKASANYAIELLGKAIFIDGLKEALLTGQESRYNFDKGIRIDFMLA